MGVAFQACEDALDRAVNELYDADPKVQAVGIGRHEDAFGFKAVRNEAKIVPSALAARARKKPLKAIGKVLVTFDTVTADVEAYLQVSHPPAASFVPERGHVLPLACGLQVQNVDDDDRQRKAGALQPGFIISAPSAVSSPWPTARPRSSRTTTSWPARTGGRRGRTASSSPAT